VRDGGWLKGVLEILNHGETWERLVGEVYAICFKERQLKFELRSYLHGVELFHLYFENWRPVDRESKFFTVGPLMMISQRDHDVIFSYHIHLHWIKRECIGCWLKLNEFVYGNDSPHYKD
jgi:hypothetical protein